jgi:hypothetical protein
VAVVRDATAAARWPEGDGDLATLINVRYLADALWTTDAAVRRISGESRRDPCRGHRKDMVMTKHNAPRLEPNTQAFIDALAAHGGQPLDTLSYADARRVPEDVLRARPV